MNAAEKFAKFIRRKIKFFKVMSDQIEEKKVNPEMVESEVESDVNSSEVETETLEEEIKNKAPQVKEVIKIIKKEGEQGMRIVDAVEPLPEEREKGEEIISLTGKKVEVAEKEYKEKIHALQNSSESEVKTISHCSACGAETRETAKFCTQCGVKLVKEEKVGQDEGDKDLSEKKTKKEILKEVEEINNKIDNASKLGLGLKEINELKRQREQLFILFDDYNGDFGTEIGKKDSIEQPKMPAKHELPKEIDNIIDEKILSEKTMQEIQRLLNDPTSEFSKAKETFDFWEKKLAEDENKLANLKGKKDNYMTERAKKSLKANIREDKGAIKKWGNEIKKYRRD